MIPFNKPFLSGKEIDYIKDAVASGKISGDGSFSIKCHKYFEQRYGFKKALLTTSCTDALEMCAILLDIKLGDEVIVPSFTFVSTANAFVLRGAKIVFADSNDTNPNIDVNKVETLISPKTKAIVVVHYAGIACDMDVIMEISKKHNLFVIEDAAQSIESFYKGKPLGSFGHLAAFSFHETKNIISGEGGLIVINDDRFIDRAEIIREKGTNRSSFFRGEVDKYGWVDIGSSFLPSDIIAAYLWAQLEELEQIQKRRIKIWEQYYSGLEEWARSEGIGLPSIPSYATNNAHMFYLLFKNITHRTLFISYLKDHGIHAVFHYLSLHKSKYFNDGARTLPMADTYSDSLVRLPLFLDLSEENVKYIIKMIQQFRINTIS